MDLNVRGTLTTLSTSLLHAASSPTRAAIKETSLSVAHQALLASGQLERGTGSAVRPPGFEDELRMQRGDNTINGVVIGLLSSFGSAILIALIFLVVYFFRYTSGGRILLDRIGRPGEYDDEQAYAREEAEALEEMDDLQRAEYMRAKGKGKIPILVELLGPVFY